MFKREIEIQAIPSWFLSYEVKYICDGEVFVKQISAASTTAAEAEILSNEPYMNCRIISTKLLDW